MNIIHNWHPLSVHQTCLSVKTYACIKNKKVSSTYCSSTSVNYYIKTMKHYMHRRYTVHRSDARNMLELTKYMLEIISNTVTCVQMT